MTDKPDDPKPATDQKLGEPRAADTPELEAEMYKVLFDHEMDRGTGMTKIPQPRRRRRLLKE